MASVSQEPFGDHGVAVKLTGAFDLSNADGLGRGIAAAGDGPRCLLLDLSEVTWLDSAAIGVIVFAARRAEDHGSSIGVVRPPDDVWQAFETLALDSLFLVFGSREEAARDAAFAA